MAVRGKFSVSEITQYPWTEGRRVILTAVTGESGLPEDARYHKYTPSGRIDILIDNPAALEQFKIGQSVYVDFTPVV